MKIKNNGTSLAFKSTLGLLPEGEYFATITKVTPELDVKTKYGPRDRVKLTYNIEDGSGIPIGTKEDVIWYNEADGSRWNLFLDALYGGDLPQVLDLQDWKGCSCWITIEHQENNGKTYANISDWNFDVQVEDEIPFDDVDEE